MRHVPKNENRLLDLRIPASSREQNYLRLTIRLSALFLRFLFFFALEHCFCNILNNLCPLSRKSKILI